MKLLNVSGCVEVTRSNGVVVLVTPKSVSVKDGVIYVECPVSGYSFRPLRGYDREATGFHDEIIRERWGMVTAAGKLPSGFAAEANIVIVTKIGEQVYTCIAR